MRKKFSWREFGEALMLVMGALIFGFSSAANFFDLPNFSEQYQGIGLLFGAFLALLSILLHFMGMREKIRVHETTRPNIVANGFQTETPFHLFRGGVPSEILERYYVVFRNQKSPGITIVDTQPIHALVWFIDSDCHVLGNLSHEMGFWDGAGEPWNRPNGYKVIIDSSSKPRTLCLFVRQQGGSDLYVFSDESYISNVRSLEPFQGHLRIPFQKFYISIQLKAGNLDMEDVWISVTNLGEQQPPRMYLIDNPCLKKNK